VNKNWVTISLVISISLCLVIGVYIMYETKAFWGKESNQNINTINTTMNFMSSTNLLPVIIVIVVAALIIGLMMTTNRGFG
jgi:hypothetical protein